MPLRFLSQFASFTLLSRVFGFVRDMMLARIFGSSDATDAFFVAFKIPNLFRRLFAEGAFSQAFVPMLADQAAQSDTAEKNYINGCFTLLAIILFVFCTLSMLAAPWVVPPVVLVLVVVPLDELPLQAVKTRVQTEIAMALWIFFVSKAEDEIIIL